MAKKIEGERVYLSPVLEEDIDYFVEFINDMEMSLFTGTFDGVFGPEEERDYFDPEDNKLQLVIHLQSTEEPIGLVEFMGIERTDRTAEIGISIGRAEDRDKGYGREAMSLMLEYGFLVLNLRSIYLTSLADNHRAISLYKSLGFRYAGTLRQHRYVAGQYRDVIYMDMLKEQLKPGRLKKELDQLI